MAGQVLNEGIAEDQLLRTLLGLSPSRTALTKSQRAYVEVRKAIVTHELPAGVPLDEAYLHSLFPMGRTPLREALKRLTHEGLLRWPPHQAPSVRDVSAHEMRFLYETRQILEPTIAQLAARRSTLTNHNAMRESVDALIEASQTGNVYLSVEHDYALHAAIAESTQDPFLAEASNHLNRQSLRLWFRAQKAHGVERVALLHRSLVEAITIGDEVGAKVLAQQHIQTSLQRQATMLGESMSIDHST